MNKLNEYFDKIYVLNLHKRSDRRCLSKKRLSFAGIDHEFFGATDGSVLKFIHGNLKNSNFQNGNYVGCAISHLCIYADALSRGFKRVLVTEDDCRIHRDSSAVFEAASGGIVKWDDLLYLGYIPLSEDMSRWDYNAFSAPIGNCFTAMNLWGLYGYGISSSLMSEIVDVYNSSFPMELDRYFVSKIQPRGKSIGVSPQIFCAEDGASDNSGKVECGMLEKSIDTRFAKYSDYV